MSHGLVKCGRGHYQSLDYASHVRVERYYRTIENTKYECAICQSKPLYLIADYDPTFEFQKLQVGTFEDAGWYLQDILKKKKDSVRKVLESLGLTANMTDSSSDTIKYSSPEGLQAIFRIRSHCKTQELFLIAPPKHDIFKKVIEANKADKRKRKLNAPPKPVLPTTQKDFLGEEVSVGDWVAFSSMNYTDLRVGKITKINEKSVTLKNREGKMVAGKSLTQIIKISKERSVLLMLEI